MWEILEHFPHLGCSCKLRSTFPKALEEFDTYLMAYSTESYELSLNLSSKSI